MIPCLASFRKEIALCCLASSTLVGKTVASLFRLGFEQPFALLIVLLKKISLSKYQALQASDALVEPH